MEMENGKTDKMCCGKSKASNSNWLKFLYLRLDVGDRAVGKTSLLFSYKNNQFPNAIGHGNGYGIPKLMETYSFIWVEEEVCYLILQVIGAEFEFLCEILLKPANILFPTNSVTAT